MVVLIWYQGVGEVRWWAQLWELQRCQPWLIKTERHACTFKKNTGKSNLYQYNLQDFTVI